MTLRTKWLASFVAILCLSAFAFMAIGYSFFVWSGGSGDGRPNYHPADRDMMLSHQAAGVTPVIMAIQKYKDEHGAFPPSLDEVQSYIPDSPYASANSHKMEFPGWQYLPDDGRNSFVLYRTIDKDQSLRYQSDVSGGSWSFDPGDGSPEKAISPEPR